MLALLLVIGLQDLGMIGFVLALALVGWAEIARFVRSEVARASRVGYVLASRATGASGVQILRAHVLRAMTPQLLGLAALEAGAVLLLLAELGFIGFFISGGSFYVDEAGRPILPVRDRLPEWGQMLAGARQYAFQQQYVAFIPAVAVVSAVLVFNLLAEGLRTASDPLSPKRLAPGSLNLVAKVTTAVLLLSSIPVAYQAIGSTGISYEDGLGRARASAARAVEGAELVGSVVHFASHADAMARPEKLTYYFRGADSELVRVSFVGADANAEEVQMGPNEDGLDLRSSVVLQKQTVTWEVALAEAESVAGTAFRNLNPSYAVMVILTQTADEPWPVYRIAYQDLVHQTAIDVRINAHTGSASVEPSLIVNEAAWRAQGFLGGPVQLLGVGARWESREQLTAGQSLSQPAHYTFDFIRSDISYPVVARVTLRVGREGAGAVARSAEIVGTDPRELPATELRLPDLLAAVEKTWIADASRLREQWIADGYTLWSVQAESCRVRSVVPGGDHRHAMLLRLVAEKLAETDRRTAVFFSDGTPGGVQEVPPQTRC